jgi:hypothetical protein
MLKRLLAGSLAIPLAAFALSACGDDGGGGGGDTDAATRPDAAAGPDGGGGGIDAAPGRDLTIDSIAGGRIESLGPDQGIRGAAQLVRMKEGLRAELYVEGLTPATDYIAHVHKLPCAENDAGSHYKHDPAIAEESEANEIWLRFTTDDKGSGKATTEQLDVTARMDAQAIVVHDPADGTKLACANLFLDDAPDATIDFEGSFTVYADAPATEANITGTAAMTVTPGEDKTTITLGVTGLDAAATYIAHVHELPCEVNKAGGHYKRDTTIAEEQEDNEIWPDLAATEAQTFDHVVRYDAQSVVIHRVEASASPKVACANLTRTTEKPEYVTEGVGQALQGVGADYRDLEATATLTRKKDGSTEANLTVAGLPEGITGFGAHVHAGTCELDPPGGPHYKLDATIAAEMEANEIWLNFDADAQGAGTNTNDKPTHVARPDAIAVVIHEPTTGTRLSCIELQ